MALVQCRICSKQVYGGAEMCPHCGAGKPGVSKEEASLFVELKATEDLEAFHVSEFRKCGTGFFDELLKRKEIK
jgi:hypothetical protein